MGKTKDIYIDYCQEGSDLTNIEVTYLDENEWYEKELKYDLVKEFIDFYYDEAKEYDTSEIDEDGLRGVYRNYEALIFQYGLERIMKDYLEYEKFLTNTNPTQTYGNNATA